MRYDIDKKPESLAELEPMILAAQEELSALCNGKKFRMSIPVDDTDSDMRIGDALRHSLAFVRAALAAAPAAAPAPPAVPCLTCSGRGWIMRSSYQDLGNGLGSGGAWNEPCPTCSKPVASDAEPE